MSGAQGENLGVNLEPVSRDQPRGTTAEWATLSVSEVMTALRTGFGGLDDEEAAGRLQRDGPNLLPRVARRPWYADLAANFVHLFALLLWIGLPGWPECRNSPGRYSRS